MIASAALQSAIHAALNGNVGAPVLDEVPPGTDPPYVVIGETTERPWDTQTDSGSIETVLIHVWSSAKGALQVKGIMAAIDAELHDARLSVAGAQLVTLRREFAEVIREPGDAGETWRHAVMRYRAFLTE